MTIIFSIARQFVEVKLAEQEIELVPPLRRKRIAFSPPTGSTRLP